MKKIIFLAILFSCASLLFAKGEIVSTQSKIDSVLKEKGYSFSVNIISEKQLRASEIDQGTVMTADEFLCSLKKDTGTKDYDGIGDVLCITGTENWEVFCQWSNYGNFDRTHADFNYLDGWGGNDDICTDTYDYPDNDLYKQFFYSLNGVVHLNEDWDTGCPGMDDPYAVSRAQRYQTTVQGQNVTWIYVPGTPFGYWLQYVFDIGGSGGGVTNNCHADPQVNVCN